MRKRDFLIHGRGFLATILCTAGLLAPITIEAQALPERALIDVPAITEAIQITRDINANSDKLAPEGAAWFKVVEGDAPIIVSAPHATQPFRDGKYRFSDGAGTAALAYELNKLSGVSIIYTTYESPSDPNFYDDNDYKKALRQLIEKKHPLLVLDLHGSAPARPYDVDFGTMDGASLLGKAGFVAELTNALNQEDIRNLSWNYFPAAKNLTVTRFASGLGVPAIQLEINATWLMPDQNELMAHRFSELLQALDRFVETQKKKQ